MKANEKRQSHYLDMINRMNRIITFTAETQRTQRIWTQIIA